MHCGDTVTGKLLLTIRLLVDAAEHVPDPVDRGVEDFTDCVVFLTLLLLVPGAARIPILDPAVVERDAAAGVVNDG